MDLDITDLEVIEAMSTYGGSFARALAQAWRAADPHNSQRIKDAFPDMWDDYRRLLDAKARRLAEGKA